MKIIFNKKIIEEENLLINYTDQAFFTGDFVNGYGWFFNNKILFWEDIYFQLMASMRKVRMNIPSSFTPEMFEEQISLLADNLNINKGRFKFSIYRNASFTVEFLPYKDFFSNTKNELDVYKEVNIYPNIFSSILVFNPINLTAKKYAEENDLQELIILNNDKRIARGISGNIFLIKDNTIYTNPVSEGALISVLKKNFISFLREKTEYIYMEENLSPFETQTAEEVFILSDEEGLLPVTKMKKKTFSSDITYLIAKKFIGYAL